MVAALRAIQAAASENLTQIPVALDALKDWSAWLVSIQAAVIALATVGLGGTNIQSVARNYLIVGLVCFAGSIVCATFVLGSIPSILIRIEEDPTSLADYGTFYQMPIAGPAWFEDSVGRVLRLWLFTVGEHFFFLVGVVCFAVIGARAGLLVRTPGTTAHPVDRQPEGADGGPGVGEP
jgi:hypothetical protein